MKKATLIPRELAERWRSTPEQVIRLIRSGRLRACNVAAPGKRARYRIPLDAVAEYEHGGGIPQPNEPLRRRRRQKKDPQFVEYF